MRKEAAKILSTYIEKAATNFSNKNREKNVGETFTFAGVMAMSAQSAVVSFLKTPSGKYALAYFKFINSGGGYFQYHMISYDELVTWAKIPSLLDQIERYNYEQN